MSISLRTLLGLLVCQLLLNPILAQEIELLAMNTDGTIVQQVAAFPDYPTVNSPEISPDGQWVGVDGWRAGETNRAAQLLFVHVVTGEIRHLGTGMMPSWSADGHWFAYSHQGKGGVYVREFDGSRERLIDQAGWGIQWSPDGKSLAYVRSGNLVIYDVAEETQRLVFPEAKSPYRQIYWNLKWSPDSQRICFKGDRREGGSEFALVSTTGSAPNLRVRCAGEDFNPDIGWSQDGQRITIPRGSKPGEAGQIYVFNPDDDQPPLPLQGQPTDRHNSGMSWSRDGKRLYFVSSR